jgi:hypothetical protein
MLKTVKQACQLNPIVHDYKMAEGVENLAGLITDQGDGSDFFSRNYVTSGMAQLFNEGLLRLAGKSDQAVFELNQAMGGGKTHLMVALGLLAKHPELRPKVLPAELSDRVDFGNARIAAFNGRNAPDHYIWGEIGAQLGEEEAIREYWVNGPKSVDQAGWKKIIGDQPTLILLDEIPPYLENAVTQQVGSGTLASMVVYTLGTLMSAALELPNCLIVIANLSGSYGQQSKALTDAVSNLSQEAKRQAQTITPVQLNGNEIYNILKKRLIDELPDESVIEAVADDYAQSIKKAEQGGYIPAASLEQVADQVKETYPFHPSFKHIVALFKENEGFRQTRGLMQFTARLLKSVDQRPEDDVYLVGAQHLDLNDQMVRDEVQRIAPTLQPAITTDIADHGNSLGEKIDAEMQSDAATQTATLLLASSLSRAVGGRVGLTEPELIEFLTSPSKKPDEIQKALERLRERAWYMHREEQRYFIKETENLTKQIERNARDVPQPKIDQALGKRLLGLLQPTSKIAYQELLVLPKLDDVKLKGNRVLIVVRPESKIPPAELANFFDYQQEKNNLLVLCGEDSHLADAVEQRLRELYAVEQISSKQRSGDTLFEEARDKKEEAEDRFHKALASAYNKVYIPVVDFDDSRKLVPVTLDQGLSQSQGETSSEKQIEALLASPRAEYKLIANFDAGYEQYWSQAEDVLWPSGKDNRRTPWKDVLTNAKCNPAWPWMPGGRGMEELKNEAIKQGRWREGKDGYIERGPFPKEKTSVNVTLQENRIADGDTVLSLTPKHAGESPQVFVSDTKEFTESSKKLVENTDNFTTDKATLYFQAIDPRGLHEAGEPTRWCAELKIRHQVDAAGDKRKVILQCMPGLNASIRYTLDGSNARDGQDYATPFEIDPQAQTLLVYASLDEASANKQFQIQASGDTTVHVVEKDPARLSGSKRVNLGGTEEVFGVVNEFKDKPGTLFRGVKIEVGEGEKTVTVQFRSREVSASVIESTINHLRESLNEHQSNVSLTIRDGASFETGFDAKEFATIAGIELRPGDIEQD